MRASVHSVHSVHSVRTRFSGRRARGVRCLLGGGNDLFEAWGVGACGEAGSVATEIALLATLVAGVTFGVAAVIGASAEHPLEVMTAVLAGLTGSGG